MWEERPIFAHSLKDESYFRTKEENRNPQFKIPNLTDVLLRDGKSFAEALISHIESARHDICLLSYIIDDDAFGQRLAATLKERAACGVRVRVLYDDVGCFFTDTLFFDALRAAGVEVKAYMPLRFRFIPLRHHFSRRVNHRNHAKCCIIDHDVLLCGGMNVAERYLQPSWYDLHALTHDTEAIYAARQAFNAYWAQPERTATEVSFQPTQQGVQFVSDTVGAMRHLFERARQEVRFCTPYFLPTPELWHTMRQALQRGVRLVLLLPRRTDLYWLNRGNALSLRRFLRLGGEAFVHTEGFVHTKLFLRDGEEALVGSMNMDYCSLRHNAEAALLWRDAENVTECRTYFQNLLNHAKTAGFPSRHILDPLVRCAAPLL